MMYAAVTCCKLLILTVIMADVLQVTPDATKQTHDTLGVIALDSKGSISAGKCIITEDTNLLMSIWNNS